MKESKSKRHVNVHITFQWFNIKVAIHVVAEHTNLKFVMNYSLLNLHMSKIILKHHSLL